MTKNEIFIKKSINIHNDKYDYSNIHYINNVTKVEIICRIHGLFQQTPRDHLNGCGCIKCGLDSMIDSKINKNWLMDFKSTHDDLYDYSKSIYISAKSKIEIICKEHGSFFQRVMDHKRGYGCAICGKLKANLKLKSNNWLSDFKNTHGDLYDYSKSEYVKNQIKIEIICEKHGSFFQTPALHKRGSGCPNCKISKGENKIMEYLLINNIDFKTQFSFDDCKFVNKLLFDFYIPSKNICIEYDGIQHFESIEHFGGDKRLKDQKNKDLIKNKWCEYNKINLLRISYKDFKNIDNILSKLF